MTDAIHIENAWLREGFAQIPNLVLRDTKLSMGARLLYAVLLSYAWQQNQCFPGQERLGNDLGVSARTIRDYLKELKAEQYLAVKRRGLGKTNLYILLDKKHSSCQRGGQLPAKPEAQFLSEGKPASDKEYSEEEYSEEEDTATPVAVVSSYFDLLGRQPRSKVEIDQLLADVVERPSLSVEQWQEGMRIAIRADRLEWRYILGCVDRMNGDGARGPREIQGKLRREAVACYEECADYCVYEPDSLVMEKCGVCPRITQIQTRQAETVRSAKARAM